MFNPQIQQIWNQAMQITNQTVPNTSKDFLVLHEQNLRENFAKLLVANCASAANKAQATESDLVGDFIIQSLGFDPSSDPNIDSSRRLLIV